MPSLKRPDGTLIFETAGSGPPLLLVSGLGGSRRYWDNLLPSLARHFTTVTLDHMGAGETQSRRTTHSIENLAADVLALADHLGIGAAHFIGHSTGAAIGQVLAAETPQRLRNLVLYAGWAGPDPHFDLCFETRKTLLRAAGAEAYHRATPLFLYPPDWIGADRQRLETLIAGMSAASPPAETLEARIGMLQAFDRRRFLSTISANTLVLCAADDQLTPLHCSRELADHIPGARLATLPWGGHAASQLAPDAFLDAVLPFLIEQAG